MTEPESSTSTPSSIDPINLAQINRKSPTAEKSIMNLNDPVDKEVSSVACSIIDTDGGSEVLGEGDVTALLDYAVNDIFTHATIAGIHRDKAEWCSTFSPCGTELCSSATI